MFNFKPIILLVELLCKRRKYENNVVKAWPKL